MMPHSRCTKIIPVIFFLLFGVLQALPKSAPQIVTIPPEEEYFTAAIFEHARRGNFTTDSPEEIKRMNLECYMKAAEIAKSKGADIIVFGEYGVYFPPTDRNELRQYLEQVPDPKKGAFNPCNHPDEYQDKPILYNLSCTAKKHEIVILANMGDIQPCNQEDNDNCPEDGSFHFNANVVFDRDGTILSKYYKEHLFFELGMDLPKERQDPIFKTDFGTFASFVCFDVMFKHMVEAAQDSRVDSVFLSTMWMDSMPFLNSLQNWQGWSMGKKATLIAANLQVPGFGAVGSGVFTAKGPLIYTYNPDGASKLIVSKVPKCKNLTEPFPNEEAIILRLTENGTEEYNEDDIDFDRYLPEYCLSDAVGKASDMNKDYRCFQESTVNYTLVKLTEPEGYLQACNNGMCCCVDYKTQGMNETFYFGVVNTTHNSFNRYFWWEEKCLVVRCDEFNGKECNLFPTKSSTVFEKLQLNANFTTTSVYPSVVRTGMRPASLKEWTYDSEREDDHYVATLDYKSCPESKPLVVAALNARCFDRDPPYIR